MLKNYKTDHSLCDNESLLNINNTDLQKIKKHRLISNKKISINDRIKKIKNKYGTYLNISQCVPIISSAYEKNSENKQNQNTNVNFTQSNDSKFEKLHQSIIKKTNKTKNNQKIKQLECINEKIHRLIDHLKSQESQSQKFIPKIDLTKIEDMNDQENIKYSSVASRVSQYNPRILCPEKVNNIINYSSANLNKSKVRSQSAEIFHAQYKHQNRQIGKISQRSSSLKRNSTRQYKNLSKSLIIEQSDQIQHKKLIKILCKQIQLDQNFVKTKTKLMKCQKNHKMLLETVLKHVKLAEEQRQHILSWDIQQMDPLFTQRYKSQLQKQNKKQLALDMVEIFRKAQDHWKYKLYHKFNRRHINLFDLDPQSKGYFLKQDLTRFISLQSKNMYNNRSINLIFKRINAKRGKIVSIADFINAFCY